MNWYIDGDHWTRCDIVSRFGNMVIVRLYTGEQVQGRSRSGLYGLLVE